MSARRPTPAAPAGLPAPKRCAIYTRKSTSAGLEQDFNSLDAQREACEQYISRQACIGWQLLPEKYDDGGFTGGNLERPAFQRLMQDAEAGKIDVVVVYKVDRLSRSLLDFAKVMDRFNNAGAAFVSVTQNFSTADAMGRLTLNMLMSFAEFERSMIAERTRDKITMARRKGKWTGGPTPLGYDVVERKLVVNESEATLIQRIYELYLAKRSAVAVAHALNAEHRTTKHHVSKNGKIRGARAWDKNAVLHILRSPIPAGLMPCGNEVHEGEHKAIVERKLYERVQALLAEGTKHLKRWGRNPEYILTGLLRCALCDQAFSPASTRKNNREYRFYRCSTRDKKGSDKETGGCPARPLPARAIEEFVIERVREALADGKLAGEVTAAVTKRLAHQRAALDTERAELPTLIATTSSEGKRLVESASNVTGAGRRLLDVKLQEVGDKLGRLESRFAEVQRKLALLDELEIESGWVGTCLQNFDRIWDTLGAENRARLVRAVISRVEVNEPNNDVRAFLTDLGPNVDDLAGAVEASL